MLYRSRFFIALTLCASVQLVARSQSTSEAAPEHTAYSHLPLQEGGPSWTFEDLRAAVPDNTVPMAIDPRAPVAKVDDPAAALLAAYLKLESIDRKDHELAFRVVGAVVKQTGTQDAIRALSLMTYHGIGTRVDKTAAVRAALPLIRTGDRVACEFAAKASPATFKTAATATTLEKLAKTRPTQPVRVGGSIQDAGSPALTLVGSEIPFALSEQSARIQAGRHVDLWGLLIDEQFVALLSDVPEPEASFKWKVNAGPVRGGTWQVHSVRVTVSNTGVQPIKSVRFSVRCFINDGVVNDQTQSAEIQDIPPGKSKAIDVGFEMYNYQYIDAVSLPKAQVTVEETQW